MHIIYTYITPESLHNEKCVDVLIVLFKLFSWVWFLEHKFTQVVAQVTNTIRNIDVWHPVLL